MIFLVRGGIYVKPQKFHLLAAATRSHREQRFSLRHRFRKRIRFPQCLDQLAWCLTRSVIVRDQGKQAQNIDELSLNVKHSNQILSPAATTKNSAEP